MTIKLPSVRVIVCGDPGTGKTMLIRTLCNKNTIERIPPTIGCSVECGLFQGPNCKVLVEYIEISGKCRDVNFIEMFHSLQPNGFIYTYSPSNKRSFNNVKSWYNACRSVDPQESEINSEFPHNPRNDENTSYIRLGSYAPDSYYYGRGRKKSLVIAMFSDSLSLRRDLPQIEGIDAGYTATSFRVLDDYIVDSLDSFFGELIHPRLSMHY